MVRNNVNNYPHRDEDLLHWLHLHKELWSWTCLQAFNSPTNRSLISTRFLRVEVEPPPDHYGLVSMVQSGGSRFDSVQGN